MKESVWVGQNYTLSPTGQTGTICNSATLRGTIAVCRGFVCSEDFSDVQIGPPGAWKVYGMRGYAGVFYPCEFLLSVGDDLYFTVGAAATISLLLAPFTVSSSSSVPLPSSPLP